MYLNKSFNIGGLMIFLLLGNLLFLVLLDFASIPLWVIWGGTGYFLLEFLPVQSISRYKLKFFLTYFIVSFLGLLLHLDNFNNTGDYFGFAGDDYKYYTFFLEVFNTGVNGLPEFSEVLALLYYPYVKVFGMPSLIGLLPFNWLITSYSVLLSHSLFTSILKRKLPFYLTVIFLLGNFVFIDCMLRFYREPVLVFFSLLAFYFLINENKIKSIILWPLIAILRGANFMIVLLFAFLAKLKSIKQALIFLLLFLAFLPIFINYFGTIVSYSSALGRVEKYSFNKEASAEEIIKRRGDFINITEGNENSNTANLYKSSGIAYYITRPAIFVFFPLRYRSLIETKTYSFKNNEIEVTGYHFFNLIYFIIISLWIYSAPRLYYGIILALRDKELFRYFFFFLFVLIASAFISFQQRHFVIGAVFIPFFIHIYKLNPIKRNSVAIISAVFFVFLMAYNLLF